MARDIFQREVDTGAPIAADATRILIPGMTDESFLGQSLQVQYAAAITRLYEIGSSKTYFVAGRTNGQMAIRRIIGGQGFSKAFIEKFGNVCNINKGNNITIDMSAGCDTSTGRGTLTARNCVISQIGYSVSTPQLFINEDVNLLFVRLDVA